MSEKTKQHYELTHEFIDKENPIYGLDENTKALILGTIYPCKCKEEKDPTKPLKHFKIPFFYGNEGSIWEILDIGLDKTKILKWLKSNNIAISDTILKTKRECGKDCSADKFDEVHTKYNLGLIDAIKASSIENIYFTSLDACKKFISEICKENGIKISNDLKLQGTTLSDLRSGSEFDILEKNYFERKIHCYILPSPSGTANRGLANNKEYKKEKLKHPELTVSKWREQFYQKAFKKYLG